MFKKENHTFLIFFYQKRWKKEGKIAPPIKSGVSNLHVSSFSWCLELLEIKIFGVEKLFFWKIFNYFFSPFKMKAQYLEIQFFQKNSYRIVLFHIIFKFRVILAFIWCTFCTFTWKIFFFIKSKCQKFLTTN